MTRSVLIVAAHIDDEAPGCGGTIARHVAEGDVVHAVFLADGVSSRPDADRKQVVQRQGACEQARRVLGIATTTFFNLPDNRLDGMPLIEIVQPLEALVRQFQPQIIYTHHCGDLNVDHRIALQAVMTACRPLPDSPVREILSFEVISSTEWNTPGQNPFMPQVYVDVTEYLQRKLDALAAYQQEMRPMPHSRSVEHIRALALHRGASVGMHAAEGFMVMRGVR